MEDPTTAAADNNGRIYDNGSLSERDAITESKDDSSDSDAAPTQRYRRRMDYSDSKCEKDNLLTRNGTTVFRDQSSSESESNINPIITKILSKSRIVIGNDSSDSDDDTNKNGLLVKNDEQQMRMKNKTNKMKQKFESLLSSRSKHMTSENVNDISTSEDMKTEVSNEESDNETSSIAKIKKKIKKSMSAMSSICDPDTSDEESNINKRNNPKPGRKKAQRSTKMIEAKPMRMSAKQAMENLQVIKSESNRMLREKAVSLPYHRPKALSLKDIMARRKPAVTSDGKALPIKMNEEQLKNYALQLEQRQKEMMELCKSESDEDPVVQENEENSTETEILTNVEIETSTNVEDRNASEKINSPTNDIEIYTETNKDKETDLENMDKSDSASPEKEILTDAIKNVEKHTESNRPQNLQKHDLFNDDSDKKDISLARDDTENVVIGGVIKETSEQAVDQIITENEAKEDVEKQIEDQETRPEADQGCLEQESKIISLHYTENDTDTTNEKDVAGEMKHNHMENETNKGLEDIDSCENEQEFIFSDDDVNMEDIDRMIENAEIMKDNYDYVPSPMLINDTLKMKPKLIGTPGMVIDLDGSAAIPKRSGIELLKERFTYFAKLKTPEEMERDRENRLKPGAQHLKLKYDLEEKMAEQRSLEWAKRLEDEKQLHQEMDAVLDNADDSDDNIDELEDKITNEDNDKEDVKSDSETGEELDENDILIEDKPRKRNPMIDQEAQESDVDENEEVEPKEAPSNNDILDDDNSESGKVSAELSEAEESTDEELSSEEDDSSENEEQTSKPKKSRILKAFENSDDDEVAVPIEADQNKLEPSQIKVDEIGAKGISSDIQSSSQDDILPLAQGSDDLFATQESSVLNSDNKVSSEASDNPLGTQTFSISNAESNLFLCPSQPYHDPNLNAVTDGLSGNVLDSQLPSQSQAIGEDLLDLCTGKFYDNEFVSLSDENKPTDSISQNENLNEQDRTNSLNILEIVNDNLNTQSTNKLSEETEKKVPEISENTDKDKQILKSLIDELDEPEFDEPKLNKYFTGANKSKNLQVETGHLKKRLVIDSDDETNETNMADEIKKKKKLKKKRLEKRALHISDDESDDQQCDENDMELEDGSDVSEVEGDGDMIQYDSEENEIEIQPENKLKKKNLKSSEFFEQEAELTSEDDWVGSGDEDEQDLDRMEREEGDDDVFQQSKLRKELGQIHMRDVLDQDKREVRLLQELLFEDGDLGDGHRQRKFRWKNTGDEEGGTVSDDLTDTQEEEFESEEQWRKQRHEREVFLRQMRNQDEEDGSPNVTVNRSTIIKANLSSKSMSTLLMEVNQSKVESKDIPVVSEKKSVKDIPSPKKSFSILQQKYHKSVLSRGSNALARLAALATPLAAADDVTPNMPVARKRNFVFTALTQEDSEPKVTIKRKADISIGTPKLVKKIRLEEKQSNPKSSLIDHLNT